MEGDLHRRVLGAVFSLLALEVVLSLVIAAAGIAVGALLFPDVLLHHPLLGVMAGAVWGVAAAAGLCYFLPHFRPVLERPQPATVAYMRSMEEFTRSLSLIVDLEELLGNQIRKIQTLTRASRVAILVSPGQGEAYTVRAGRGYGSPEILGVALHDGGGLARWLFVNETCLVPQRSSAVMGFLTEEDREILARLEVDAVFPLVALNRLVGMIFVSCSDGVTPDSIEAMSWFAPQMALSLAGALLYEQQQVRMRRLYRAERLATTGQLAAGAAHEIRNPLTSIRSTIQYLKGSLQGDPERSEMVGDLIEETDRINAIVQGMLSFARPAEPRFEPVDLTDVLAQTVRLVDPTARKAKVAVEMDLPEGAAVVQADPDQLKQVFLNVMMNAVQAMPDGGRLAVSVTARGDAAGVGWRVAFSDTGVGIPAAHREKVFDPFFTTKRDGTGLGLSICYSILQNHGGEIDVESREGEGTRVEIRL